MDARQRQSKPASLSKSDDEFDPGCCPVCLERFDDDCDSGCLPRLLPCGHSFCESCLNAVLSSARARSSSAVCPQCRAPIGASSVTALPKNFALLELIPHINRSSRGLEPHQPHTDPAVEIFPAGQRQSPADVAPPQSGKPKRTSDNSSDTSKTEDDADWWSGVLAAGVTAAGVVTAGVIGYLLGARNNRHNSPHGSPRRGNQRK